MVDKEVKKLKQKIKKAEEQAQEYLNGWKRARADYINFERETEKEKVEWIKFANLEIILNFLQILDSLDSAVENLTDDLKKDEWVIGILNIKEQFENFLKSQSVKRIKTIGEKFSPDYHEAIEKKGDKGKIIKEIQAGYIMHGKVIRTAKVIIN